jgi:hypothetical protein
VSAAGPFDTEDQALAVPAVRMTYDLMHESHEPVVMPLRNGKMLVDACIAAGVDLGHYDHQIITWLAGWEPQMCAVIAGLITRAHAAGRDGAK